MHDDVVAAARATLDSGAARVRRTRLTGAGEVWTTEEGVTDFAARRTRLEMGPSPKLEELAERFGRQLDERWPWLSDEPDANHRPYVMLYAGTAALHGPGEDWTQLTAGDRHATRRHPADPAWVLEALTRAHVVSTASDGQLGFVLDLNHRHEALELPPYSGRRPVRMGGEAWVDDEGRLSRLTLRDLAYTKRPRIGSHPARPAGSQRLELWDFGVPVEIDVPELPRRRLGAELLDWARIGRDLRRRRREYRKTTP